MDWIQLGILVAVSVSALTPIFSYVKRRWQTAADAMRLDSPLPALSHQLGRSHRSDVTFLPVG